MARFHPDCLEQVGKGRDAGWGIGAASAVLQSIEPIPIAEFWP